jgi:D-arabinose 1-dehydrogenase-like Zn-dependent alcohol dehydrogenase
MNSTIEISPARASTGSSPLSKGGEIIHYYQGQSSFATHAVIRERSVVKVPKKAPLEMLAPLGCGIMTGAGAVINSLGVGIDDSVVVFGTGSVGLSAIMAAKLVGAGTIIAVDLVESRLALARELGATHAINPQTQSAPEAIRRILPLGVDFVVDTTANANVLRDAVALLAPRGTLGMVGGAPKGLEFPLDVEHVLTGGRTVRGIIEGDANPDVFLPKLIDLFVKGKFPIDRLVTFYPFARINDAICAPISALSSQRTQILTRMERAEKEGVRFALDGRGAEVPEAGFYLAPSIAVDVDPKSSLAQEEIFGPVLSVLSFDSIDEAIALANGTRYGLGASIWSNNLDNVFYIAKRLVAGNININGGTGPVVELPFGGFKESGFGRDRSLHAIDKYSDLKNVIIRTAR